MVCTGRAGAVTVFTGLTLPQGGCRACVTLQQSMRLTPCGKVSPVKWLIQEQADIKFTVFVIP